MVVAIVVRTIPTTGLPLHQPLTTLPILTTDLLGAHRDARAARGRRAPEHDGARLRAQPAGAAASGLLPSG